MTDGTPTGDYIFNTPAFQGPKDYDTAGGTSADLQRFLQSWNTNLGQWTAMAAIGNPWSSLNDAPRAYYFNPMVTGWPDAKPQPVEWVPFPNRLITFFQNPNIIKGNQLPAALTDEQLLELADLGRITVEGGTWKLFDPASNADDVLRIPAAKCPDIDWAGDYMTFSPAGPRGWLDEYCEWSITWKDDQPGTQIQSVMFTCENPAYWQTLWNEQPDIVLKLYQTYIDPAVRPEDLYLTYPAGNPKAGEPVIDPTTGRPAYNPTNKWNSGTLRVPGQAGGAMHLTSPPNTLSAEVYLAAASTIQRIGISPGQKQPLICCAQYGQSFRNSDPNIGAAGNLLSEKQLISLADPVGLYIQTPNWSLFKTPDDTPAWKFWTVRRGVTDPNGNADGGSDSILNAVFEVPSDKPYGIGDIQILNLDTGVYENIRWAGQIAKTFKIALRVVAMTPPAGTSPNAPVSCVSDRPSADLQPWPAQFVPTTLFYGGSPTDLPSRLAQGTTVSMALVVQGASSDTTTANARIEFDNPGVTGIVSDFIPDAGAIPGLTNAGGTQAYVVQVTVAKNAATGPLGIRALNPSEGDPAPSSHPFQQGLAQIVGG